MKGPFYVRDKDFSEFSGEISYIPAECCKECGFFDEEYDFCPMNPCIYFCNLAIEEDGTNGKNDTEEH